MNGAGGAARSNPDIEADVYATAGAAADKALKEDLDVFAELLALLVAASQLGESDETQHYAENLRVKYFAALVRPR